MKAIPLLIIFFVQPLSHSNGWEKLPTQSYDIFYKPSDRASVPSVQSKLATGTARARAFVGQPFRNHFEIYVHPGRQSLDSTWQHNWNMPDFHSACWMVASGVGTRLDLLSPAIWKTASCEHDGDNQQETEQLITHELVHVFHGQHNPSPDFSEVQGLDWFVEGLATYASGQCDTKRIQEVKAAIEKQRIPAQLEAFWTGSLRYGLSGSMVMYLDETYGRSVLLQLLMVSTQADLLKKLHVSETELLAGWKQFMVGK